MLPCFHHYNYQFLIPRIHRSFSECLLHLHRHQLLLSTVPLPSKPYRRFPFPILSSSSASVSTRSEDAKETDFDFSSSKETETFSFDGTLELSELKRLNSRAVEVKELDEIPEQWRRSKLAWLCKELPAHRSSTFIRVLNAQRKWIRQDDCTFIAVHCMRIRENEAAFRVYKWMMQQHWFKFDFALGTKLADYMGKERKYLKCREIFNDITNQGLVPDESTFHILIVAYLSVSGLSCLEEACSVYNSMIHLGGYKPRLSLHNALFRALVSKPGASCKHHLKQAEFIFHNLMTSGLEIHSDIYAGLIRIHSYQDVIDKERIESLRLDMKSAGIEEHEEVLVMVLRACSKESDVGEAERTWSKIVSSNDNPPPPAYVYLMEVYSMAGKPMKSVEVFRDMQERRSPSATAYHKIIEILCKAEEAELAESLLNDFIKSGFKPLMKSFVDLMDMYASLSLHAKLESTFHRCLEKCCPNHTVYNIYLSSLVQIENLDRAEEIFNQMHCDEAVGVDAKSCNTILLGYLACGHHAKAEKIYDLMCRKKYEVDSSLMEKLEPILSSRQEDDEKPTNLKLSKEQREILMGLLLSGLKVKFDEEKKNYFFHFVFRENSKIHFFLKRHIYNQFHEWLAVKHDNDIPCQFSTMPHSYFQFYADQFWPQGQPVIPKLIHRWLTPRVIAYWYMCGGYRTSSGDILLKLKFEKEDVMRIVKTFRAQSMHCRVKRKGTVFWIGFIGSDAVALWKLAEPFVLADLKESLEAGIMPLNGTSRIKNISFGSDSDTDGNVLDSGEDNDVE